MTLAFAALIVFGVLEVSVAGVVLFRHEYTFFEGIVVSALVLIYRVVRNIEQDHLHAQRRLEEREITIEQNKKQLLVELWEERSRLARVTFGGIVTLMAVGKLVLTILS
jgi:hypothetical protein